MLELLMLVDGELDHIVQDFLPNLILGIVTKMTMWLMPIPEYLQGIQMCY